MTAAAERERLARLELYSDIPFSPVHCGDPFSRHPSAAVANGFVDNVQTHQYHWDLENRLLGVDDLPDNLAWEYQYDHQDRRPLIDALSGRGS